MMVDDKEEAPHVLSALWLTNSLGGGLFILQLFAKFLSTPLSDREKIEKLAKRPQTLL